MVLRMSIFFSDTAKLVSQTISPSNSKPSEFSTRAVTSGEPATPR